MDSYIDIRVRPEVDLNESTLLSSLFGELHERFVEMSGTSTGISFPNATAGLGDTLRLHDDESTLRKIVAMPWLVRAADYYRVELPRAVPTGHRWCMVSRKQPRMSASRARRMIARGTLEPAEAERLLLRAPSLDEPYVQLSSRSTGQRFRLFIEQRPCEPPSDKPSFSKYGLGGAVPWF